MSDLELQDDNDDVQDYEHDTEIVDTDEETEAGEQEESETEAELAPADEGQRQKKTKVTFSPEQQALFEEKTGKRVWAQKDAERRAKEAEQKYASLLAEKSQVAAPVVPPKPEQWDENYDQKLADWQSGVQQHAQWNAEQAVLARQHQEAAIQAQQAKQQSLQESVAEYSKQALKLGVSKEELASAGQAVGNYGINQDLVEAILIDPNGPLITTHLAKNPEELDHISRLNPVSAAMYIAKNIVPKLSARKPKITNAPEPAPVLRGNGAPQKDKYHVEGATFK